MRRLATRARIQRYGFAVAACLVALVISLLFQPLFEGNPFLLFFPALILAAAYGGLGPALLATLLSVVLTDWFLLAPTSTLHLDLPEVIRVLVFAGVGVLISSVYLARRRGERQLGERLNALSGIYELSDAVNRAASVEAVYDTALDGLMRGVGADRASILLFDANGVMQFKAWRGLAECYRTATTGHSPWTVDSVDPQPVLVPNVETDTTLGELRPVILGEGIRALAFIPITAGTRLLGKFMVYYHAPHTFTPEEVQTAQTIARHIAYALDRRHAEQELRQSRQQLEVILHGITDGITVQEPSGKLIYANASAAQIIGFATPGELIVTPVQEVITRFELMDESGAPFPLSRLPGRLALQGQVPSEEIMRFRIKATGEEHWSIVNAAPVFDAQGRVQFAVNIFRDFTARRRLEDAERAQRELLQVTLRSIGDAVIATDLETRITFMNPIAEQLTGWSQPDAQGKRLADVFKIINEQTRQPVESPADKVLARGVIVGLANHTVLLARDGRELPIDDSGAPIRGRDGMVVGVILVFRDVTEERRAQTRLALLAEASHILSSSLDYETTLKNVAQFIVPQFADWCTVTILQEDGALQQLAVAHKDPARVESIHELQRRYPLDPNATRGVAQVIRTGQPELIPEIPDSLLTQLIQDPDVLQIIRDLGLRSSMTVPLTARERVFGAVSFTWAESGHLYGAEDLAFAQDLARRAAMAIDNARLYARAESAIGARDQFLSLASHELRTPITSIAGFAELLERRAAHAEALTERDHRALQLIYEQSNRLTQLINSMLDLSRIELGQFSIERAPVDLNGLTRKTIDAVRLTLERHQLVYAEPTEPLIVMGDELRLEQVLQNLIQNAIKYSPRGGRVEARLERREQAACFTVTDEGIGIPRDELPNLFQRFARAGNARALPISGMGVGLFVVRQIVNLHGGRVEVSSEEGRGSTFRVYLPLAVPAATDVPGELERAA